MFLSDLEEQWLQKQPILGVPTISYNAVPNRIEKYLVKNDLIKRIENPENISNVIKKIFTIPLENNKIKIKNIPKNEK